MRRRRRRIRRSRRRWREEEEEEDRRLSVGNLRSSVFGPDVHLRDEKTGFLGFINPGVFYLLLGIILKPLVRDRNWIPLLAHNLNV